MGPPFDHMTHDMAKNHLWDPLSSPCKMYQVSYMDPFVLFDTQHSSHLYKVKVQKVQVNSHFIIKRCRILQIFIWSWLIWSISNGQSQIDKRVCDIFAITVANTLHLATKVASKCLSFDIWLSHICPVNLACLDLFILESASWITSFYQFYHLIRIILLLIISRVLDSIMMVLS